MTRHRHLSAGRDDSIASEECQDKLLVTADMPRYVEKKVAAYKYRREERTANVLAR
jgi:hypothetical protein